LHTPSLSFCSYVIMCSWSNELILSFSCIHITGQSIVGSFFQLAELKGHTKELKAKTEENPKKDAEKVKLSNEGATFPDPTNEKIAEEEEELGDENDVSG